MLSRVHSVDEDSGLRMFFAWGVCLGILLFALVSTDFFVRSSKKKSVLINSTISGSLVWGVSTMCCFLNRPRGSRVGTRCMFNVCLFELHVFIFWVDHAQLTKLGIFFCAGDFCIDESFSFCHVVMWAARTCAKMNCVSVRSYIRICAEGVFQSSRAICTVSPCLQNGVDLSSSPPAPSPHTYTRRKLLKAIVLPVDLTRAFDALRCAKSVRAVVRRFVFAPPEQLLFSEWFLSFSGYASVGGTCAA